MSRVWIRTNKKDAWMCIVRDMFRLLLPPLRQSYIGADAFRDFLQTGPEPGIGTRHGARPDPTQISGPDLHNPGVLKVGDTGKGPVSLRIEIRIRASEITVFNDTKASPEPAQLRLFWTSPANVSMFPQGAHGAVGTCRRSCQDLAILYTIRPGVKHFVLP